MESVFGALEMSQLLNKFPGLSAQDIEGLVEAFRHVILKTLEERIQFRYEGNHLYPTEHYAQLAELFGKLAEHNKSCT